jgi:2-desacetyl-2-hydroxyethyl bacteriochlorophyllide A dehydrogenase
MKAAVCYGQKDIRVENVDMPKILPGWLLLKVRASGICGSDLHLYKEKTPFKIESVLGEGRYVPGHELSGEVVKLGPEVSDLKEGDRVTVEPLVGCGRCHWCQVGWYNLCANFRLIGFYYLGGLAEYCAVPADKCFKLPENLSFEEAATLDCVSVAIHAVNTAKVSSEDTVAVLGAGTIGLFALQAARVAGAREVFVVGRHGFQLEVANALGATMTIDARKEPLVEKMIELTDGRGVDKIIEAAGGESSAIADAISMARRRCTIVTTGIFVKPMPIELVGLLTKELTLSGAWGYGYWTHMKEFAMSLELLAKGKIKAEPLITHRYPLERVAEAYEAAIDKARTRSIKVQIVF